MADILYFARLAESLGMKSETIDLSAECNTVADLVGLLRTRGEPFASVLNGDTPVLIAVNQEMTELASEIVNTDEIAFFPPVTGG